MIFTNALTNPGGTNGLIQARADIAREGFTAAQPMAKSAQTYATTAATGLQAKADHMWNDAADYNSTAREGQQVGKAMAGVTQQFGAARDQMDRQAASLGLDPSSNASILARARMSMGEALGKSQAATNTREALESEGWKRKMAAAGLGLESANAGTNLMTTPFAIEQKLYGDLAKGYGDVLDASLKSDANETSRMSAAAAASNAATNASLAGGRLALDNRRLDADIEKDMWGRTNLTPYQAATLAAGARTQDSNDLAALARSFPGVAGWLKSLGGGTTSAADLTMGPSATPPSADLGLDQYLVNGPGSANGMQDIDPGQSYTPGLEDYYYVD